MAVEAPKTIRVRDAYALSADIPARIVEKQIPTEPLQVRKEMQPTQSGSIRIGPAKGSIGIA